MSDQLNYRCGWPYWIQEKTIVRSLANTPPLDGTALQEALANEAAYNRTWLPREPWWDDLTDNAEQFEDGLRRQLQRGRTFSQATVVNVRKPGHGIRPVEVMSPEARVTYRALASEVLATVTPPERSASAYAEFVLRPIREAFTQPGLRRLGDARYGYVLEADLAAFYQYIDHSVLRQELDIHGQEIAVTDALIEFLAEIEGRSFGIPQRSETSDWLAELYAQRIQNELTRKGYLVWRYSDDFRIGCSSWMETLEAIEALSTTARQLGLIPNDSKTSTPSFSNYFFRNVNLDVDDIAEEFDPQDVEAAVTADYTPEGDEQALEDARAVLNSVGIPGNGNAEPRLDLKSLTSEQHREIRRALNTLAKFNDTSAIPHLLDVLTYQPAMTHRIMEYAKVIAEDEPEPVKEFLGLTTERLSLNGWQVAWVSHAYRECGFEIDPDSGIRSWLDEQFYRREASLARAEAGLTLATHGQVSFESLDRYIKSEPEDLISWHLTSLQRLASQGLVPEQRLSAFVDLTPSAQCILSQYR